MVCETGETAKQIFERAQLPNEVLGRIWNLADTEQKGELGLTEFIIAMHLLASYRSGSMRALPSVLPAGLYEAASRRRGPRQLTGSRPGSGVGSVGPIPRQFSGGRFSAAPSPEIRPAYPQSQISSTPVSEEWAISPRDKEAFDQIYTTLDTTNRGFITGDQAVDFFSNSRLPEHALAEIWDLADINSEGRLNRDEFAVAMFLIRQQRTKKDGRDVLPKKLPPNLIPPSMRRQPHPSPQPPTPLFDNAANTTVPRSASEDLFGLDVFTSPSPEASRATGNSTLQKTSGLVTPQVQQPQQQLSTFKPFVPSSSFGQAMMTPQSTGLANLGGTSENRGTPQKPVSTSDDLLGDNDPEVSKSLTHETTELANLSNQVSNLTSQMQAVRSKRVSTEQELSKAQAQKREFEIRLSQLRSAYEQEVAVVKALEGQLSTSRSEIKKLEHDLALVDGTYQDLQNQHAQVAGALDADQKENLRLKEQIRQTNNEISELKPQLEKLKSELRHQKGLVTINKKQLATNESERGILQGDLERTRKESEDTLREIEEIRSLEGKPDAPKSMLTASPLTASPPTSSSSMNPFFRQATASPEKSLGSPFMPPNSSLPNHNAFDSLFGPSLALSTPPSGPPPTSFRADSPSNIHASRAPVINSTLSTRSSDGPDVPTPSESPPPSAYNDSSYSAGVPPPPPQSRQITSSYLPLRNLARSDSTSSSVRVVPPASRMGDSSGFDTPKERQFSYSDLASQNYTTQLSDETDVNSTTGDLQSGPATPHHVPSPENGQESVSQEMPGAFPGGLASSAQPLLATSDVSSGHVQNPSNEPSTREHDPFGPVHEQSRTLTSGKDDFDAAFESFSNPVKASEKSNGAAFSGQAGQPKTHGEFPPIQDIGADEDSDSDYSDHGFDDNFTAASPHRPQNVSNDAQASQSHHLNKESYLAPLRPLLTSNDSNESQLPTPGAQTSPPTYNQTIAPIGRPGQARESNQFPAEYTGLLPSRANPTSLPTSPPSNAAPQKDGSPAVNEKGLGLISGTVEASSGSPSASVPVPFAPGASAAPYAYEQSSTKHSQPHAMPPVPGKTALTDDFDNEFGDLSEAKEADDKGEDEFNPAPKDGFDEFNPVFDSPIPSRSAAHAPGSTFPAEDDFRNFESSISGSAIPTSNSRRGTDQAPSSSHHDWDAIFAGLETPQNNGVQGGSKPVETSDPEHSKPPRQAGSADQSSKPPLPRGLSMGTDHDDPILKRLTGMGYPRDASLEALEKFDYNIDMVR